MVVDALDLCYTKDHIDTFVIISGDSDFSPAGQQAQGEREDGDRRRGSDSSTSDLLMSNCDEFIFYDDLITESSSQKKRRRAPKKKPAKTGGKSASADKGNEAELQDEGIDLVVDVAEALIQERGDSVWGSMVKQTLKRRQPGFRESTYGFRAFSDLLEEAEARGQLQLEADEKSGGYLIRSIDRR